MKLLLVSSSKIFCEGLASLLESKHSIDVVWTASTPSEAVEAAAKHRPDAVVVDIQFSQSSNVEAIQRIRQILPDTRVIVFTPSISSTDFFSAIKAGATGYIPTDTDVESFVEKIALVIEGNLLVSPPIAEMVIDVLKFVDSRRHQASVESIKLLSERERAVLALIAKGATNKQIASILFLSENTIRVHVRNIMQKLRARNRMEARVCAIIAGLLPGITQADAKQT